jgi:hypothetical protein
MEKPTGLIMENNKILAIFTDTVTEGALETITAKHKGLVHDFSNEAEFKAARKVNTEMNKLLKAVDTVGIAAAKQVTALRNDFKDQIEEAYSGTVYPFYIEDQKRKNEAQRIKDEKDARLAEQSAKLAMIKGASARAMHLPIDDIEDILQEVMSIDLAFFDEDMQQEAKSSKEISLAQLQDAFKFAGQKEEMRKAEEIQRAELADKDDEITKLKAMLEAQQPKEVIADDPFYFMNNKPLHRQLDAWFDNNNVSEFAIKELEEILTNHFQ